LRAYYLGTPLFWLLDYWFGVRIRVAFLDDLPALRYGYYLLCFGIGIIAIQAPRYASRLAFFESAANLGLIIVSVGIWYLRMIDWAGSPSAMVPVITPWELVNFVLAAATAAVSYVMRSLDAGAESRIRPVRYVNKTTRDGGPHPLTPSPHRGEGERTDNPRFFAPGCEGLMRHHGPSGLSIVRARPRPFCRRARH
jgi:hypothetical protein